MKPPRILGFSLSIILVMFCSGAWGASTPQDNLPSRLREFLDMYARKDIVGLMSLVGDDSMVVMGSDLSEVCTSRPQVEELLRNDFRLWDSASFGPLSRVFIHQSRNTMSAFFDVPFTMRRGGNEQTVVVRFATVWGRTARGLKLIQSMNTVPTVGQSAKDLLAPKR